MLNCVLELIPELLENEDLYCLLMKSYGNDLLVGTIGPGLVMGACCLLWSCHLWPAGPSLARVAQRHNGQTHLHKASMTYLA